MTISNVDTKGAVQGVPAVPRPGVPAYIIQSDAEAIAIPKRVASEIAPGAAIRDRDRIWPVKELDASSQSGLWSINVPKKFGGPEVSYATLAKVIEIVSAADSSIGQIAQNHLGVVAAIRTVSDEAQQKPDLLLALVGRAPFTAHPVLGHVVTQPFARAAQDFDVLGQQPDFLVQLAEHGLFR